MKTNTGNLQTQMGPRRAPVYADETEYGHDWVAKEPGRWKRALWLLPLGIVSVGLVVMAGMSYMREPAPPVHDGGLVIKDITFESGSLTDLATGAAIVKSGVNLEHDAPMKGLYSAFITGGSAYLEQPLPGTSDLYMSFYVRLMELPPSGDLRLVHLSTGKTTVGNLLVRNGRLRLRVDKSPVGADSDPIVPGQLYRIGVHQRAGTGSNAVLEAFLASGDTPFAAPFAVMTNGTWTDGADRVRFGMTTGNGVHAFIDDVRLHADDMPAPSEAGRRQ